MNPKQIALSYFLQDSSNFENLKSKVHGYYQSYPKVSKLEKKIILEYHFLWQQYLRDNFIKDPFK